MTYCIIIPVFSVDFGQCFTYLIVNFLHLSKYCQYQSLLAGFKQFQAVLVDFMLCFVQFGGILGEVVETFRDLF